VSTGDKPKALVLLDALEACRELSSHGLNVRQGLGKRLAQRLYIAATIAPNSRAYHPTRSMHDRLLQLMDLGLAPGNKAFPDELLQIYLAGDAEATTEAQRTALGRYLAVIQKLGEAEQPLDHPGVDQFVALMCGSLLADHELISAGAKEVGRVLSNMQIDHSEQSRGAVAQALAVWAETHGVRR
jgi:hypothetical protein